MAVVTVLSRDGERRSFDAELVGADRARDLAVLRVAAPRDLLQPAALAGSGAVRVGQQVLSIGNPFGAFDHTLTMGGPGVSHFARACGVPRASPPFTAVCLRLERPCLLAPASTRSPRPPTTFTPLFPLGRTPPRNGDPF